jgi:small neutral amino acid transporter SnatA (MarC family)
MIDKILKSFFTLFVAMNVIGVLPIFILLTENFTLEQKIEQCLKVSQLHFSLPQFLFS